MFVCPSYPPYVYKSYTQTYYRIDNSGVRFKVFDSEVRMYFSNTFDTEYKFGQPSGFFYLYDSLATDTLVQTSNGASNSNQSNKIHLRHSGCTNALSIDGHVEAKDHAKILYCGGAYTGEGYRYLGVHPSNIFRGKGL